MIGKLSREARGADIHTTVHRSGGFKKLTKSFKNRLTNQTGYDMIVRLSRETSDAGHITWFAGRAV